MSDETTTGLAELWNSLGTGSADERQQIQSQHGAGHQAGPFGLFHAQESNRVRPRSAGRRAGPELILPWPQPTRTPNWMRLKARPRPVAEPHSWRWSATSLRWAKPAIRRIDWELRPGAHITSERHNDLEHPPQWQVRNELESHARRQRPVMR